MAKTFEPFLSVWKTSTSTTICEIEKIIKWFNAS